MTTKQLPYDPKVKLKYYTKEYKRKVLELEMGMLFFFLVPVAWFVIGPALIYGVMTVIDYLKRFI